MVVSIVGVGTALPGSAISTEALISSSQKINCAGAKQERVLAELYKRAGIATRHTVLSDFRYREGRTSLLRHPFNDRDFGPSTAERMACYERESSHLSLTATSMALHEAGLPAGSVTHLVTVSCTGFSAPGFDLSLVERLPLPRHVERTHIGFMGCHGALNGLRVAKALAQTDDDAIVLLCATELCSLHFHYGWSSDGVVANSLFADGAGSLVCASIADSAPRQSGTFDVLRTGSFVVPDTASAMTWRIGDHGFNMHLSAQVAEIINDNLPGWLESWLSESSLTIGDISGWAVHPGGKRILDAVEQSLALAPQALAVSRSVLSECGNMSSPTVLFILERLRSIGIRGLVLLLAFGPGLTIEAALLEAH